MPTTRHFRNTLPDYQQAPLTTTSAETFAAIASESSQTVLLGLFQETLSAVQAFRTSNPTIYTGAAGVAYALWHARRGILRNRDLSQQAARAAAAAGGASTATTSAPAGPVETTSGTSPTTTPTPSIITTVSSSSNDLPGSILAAALEHSRAALAALTGPKGLGLSRGSRSASMLDGGAGVHMTAALVLHDAASAAAAAGGGGVGTAAATALLKDRDAQVRAFLDAYPEAMDSENDEYLYGRAGYLQGAQLLNAHLGEGTVPEEVVEGVATEILESGREMAGRLRWRRTDTPPPPLFFMWPHREQGEPYLGAAHGLMGILFALLHCRPVVQQNADELRASLAYVASHELDAPGCTARGGHYPTRMSATPLVHEDPAARGGKVLVHWCHGSPGAVFLWCKAHQVLGDAAYLDAALRAGEVVWQLGLLRKGHGLCHGTSGNAYALLALHRATGGDPRWLHRARMFGEHVGSQEGRSVYDTPDRPLSLFEGRAAALCLLADLLAEDGGSQGSRFPAFELP